MRLSSIDIMNFRKLKSTTISISKEKTIFVGANNSGKTSAIYALDQFLNNRGININDFTISNWIEINKIGQAWVNKKDDNDENEYYEIELRRIQRLLPTLDLWIQVSKDKLYYVIDLLPTLDWDGEPIGIRFIWEPNDLKRLEKEYIRTYKKSQENGASWPKNLHHFLESKMNEGLFKINCYKLDPSKFGLSQELTKTHSLVSKDSIKSLIRIDKINAQREHDDTSSYNIRQGSDFSKNGNLSVQLRDYCDKHLIDKEIMGPKDMEAQKAISDAQEAFDKRLKIGLKHAIEELEMLGYPGFTDPNIIISTKIELKDGLNHPSSVRYNFNELEGIPQIPEKYLGLGYRNLISMSFQLMQFRDDWLDTTKMEDRELETDGKFNIQPIHLVLIEEPEAHLHIQSQTVFINKSYDILRNHMILKEHCDKFTTQMIISTHSSDITHETCFGNLRYFKRFINPDNYGIPTSKVINLENVFNVQGVEKTKEEENKATEKFVTRYIQSTHCNLLFADAIIIVEGAAERILLPHFIDDNFKELSQRYISILDIGGSHAHRFKPLIEILELPTLIITDVDVCEYSEDKKGIKRKKTIEPCLNSEYITSNSTLIQWIPKEDNYEKLIKLTDEDKVINNIIRVAYQCTECHKNNDKEFLSRTFESSLVYRNIDLFKRSSASGLIKKYKKGLEEYDSKTDSYTFLLHQIIDKANSTEKAEFACDILYEFEPKELTVPTYIYEGLEWLDKVMKQKECHDVV